MRSGMFPSQRQMLRRVFKKADKFDHFRRRTRRSLVLGGAAALAAAVGSFWVGTRMGLSVTATPTAATGTPPWLDQLAVGPLSELQRQAPLLLGTLSAKPADHVAWQGFHRLVAVAADQADQEGLRRMLVQVATHRDAPIAAREAIARLQRRAPR